MRTTVDLPDDLHTRLRRTALDRHISMSRLVAQLLQEGLEGPSDVPHLETGEHGFPVARIGRPITSEEVAAIEEDEVTGGW